MTVEEMREKTVGLKSADRLAGAADLWNVTAEICERLEAIQKRLDEPMNVYTKSDPGITE